MGDRFRQLARSTPVQQRATGGKASRRSLHSQGLAFVGLARQLTHPRLDQIQLLLEHPGLCLEIRHFLLSGGRSHRPPPSHVPRTWTIIRTPEPVPATPSETTPPSEATAPSEATTPAQTTTVTHARSWVHIARLIVARAIPITPSCTRAFSHRSCSITSWHTSLLENHLDMYTESARLHVDKSRVENQLATLNVQRSSTTVRGHGHGLACVQDAAPGQRIGRQTVPGSRRLDGREDPRSHRVVHSSVVTLRSSLHRALSSDRHLAVPFHHSVACSHLPYSPFLDPSTDKPINADAFANSAPSSTRALIRIQQTIDRRPALSQVPRPLRQYLFAFGC